jgi:acetyltransferase-like isoleucine patch superfamily enzyme
MIRLRTLRTLSALVAVFLPRVLRRFVHVRLLGYRLHPTASIGHSFVDVMDCEMGAGAVIGHLNIIRGLETLRMARLARISNLNWINAVGRDKGVFEGIERELALVMGYNTTITIMHFIECCAKVELRDRACLAGYWTQLLTHTFDYRTEKQTAKPVTIGERTVISTRCTILPGITVADRCLVAAGSVIHGKLRKPQTLYAGSPARSMMRLPDDSPLVTSTETTVR